MLTYSLCDDFLSAIETVVSKLGHGPSPSDSVKSELDVETTTLRNVLLYGRPCLSYRPPVSLFNRQLAILAQDLDQPPAIPPSEPAPFLVSCMEFMKTACAFYDTEESRRYALKNLLSSLFPGHHGTWTIGQFSYAILELHNSRGGNADPRLQTLVSYEKDVSKLVSACAYRPGSS